MKLINPSVLATALLLAISPVNAQNGAAGKASFGVCSACHGVAQGEKKMGPSLFAVVGRKAGSVPGYFYSPAFKKLSRTWSPAELDAFLKAPSKRVPGTKMYFGGITDDTKRGAVVTYLTTLK